MASCGGTSGATDTVVVGAAASLTESFTAIGALFEAEHPDVEITFNFAGSSDLAAQIGEGAPVDVFASADLANMSKVAEAVAGQPVVFATNRMVIVVADGNPLGIAGLDDLDHLDDPDGTDDPDLILVTCAPAVPCGAYATQVAANAGVELAPDSYEENVKAVVTKVALGEADAGLAYATDAAASADRVDAVELPADVGVVAEYPIAVVAGTPNATAATAFVDFVVGPAGQRILAEHGFGAP